MTQHQVHTIIILIIIIIITHTHYITYTYIYIYIYNAKRNVISPELSAHWLALHGKNQLQEIVCNITNKGSVVLTIRSGHTCTWDMWCQGPHHDDERSCGGCLYPIHMGNTMHQGVLGSWCSSKYGFTCSRDPYLTECTCFWIHCSSPVSCFCRNKGLIESARGSSDSMCSNSWRSEHPTTQSVWIFVYLIGVCTVFTLCDVCVDSMLLWCLQLTKTASSTDEIHPWGSEGCSHPPG